MVIDASFERISKYANDKGVIIPTRKTIDSAGYDFYAAEDTVIPAFDDTINVNFANNIADLIKNEYGSVDTWEEEALPYSLDEIASLIKKYGAKVTLVPTGIKCKIPSGHYLQLAPRSSLPLKHWIIMANGIGIIDADYYNNTDNEGHIYFQLINLLPVPVKIKKGECFGQGIILPYCTCADETQVTTERTGGFGSTNE